MHTKKKKRKIKDILKNEMTLTSIPYIFQSLSMEKSHDITES